VAQDFAKKKNTSPRKGPSGSGIPDWVWLLTGAVTGAFIMFLFYLSGLTPQKLNDNKAAQNTPDKTADVQNADKPTFEFYDSLKNNEIIPPGDSKKHSTDSSTSPGASYLLQVGSFPKLQDADALKAKLILEGLDTNIQPFNKNGQIYNRVLVGPFTDQNKMNQAKATLAQHNITPIVLQKKPRS